jgi:naphtho-gamma-pyrone polyketide synthase
VESDSSSPPPPDSPITDIDEMSDDDILTIDLNKSAEKTKDPVPTAWSISLQGSPKRAAQILFLFPDGCGAATSYLGLPKIKDSLAVVGFNSPYMKNPTAMHERTLEEVVNSYVTALQTRQPHGPYWLGGWSAGGILAYAVAQQLMAAGEEVSKLVLIDSPAPTKGLDRLPARFFDHCNSVGLFGNEMKRGDASGAPEWLMPHFRAQIELLHDYCAPPMSDAAKNMHVTIVWAGACAFDGVRYAHIPPPATAEEAAEDTEGMKFLSEPRKDLGSGEWAALFPNCKVDVRVMHDEHHFSMMRDNGAQVLGEYLREALA